MTTAEVKVGEWYVYEVSGDRYFFCVTDIYPTQIFGQLAFSATKIRAWDLSHTGVIPLRFVQNDERASLNTLIDKIKRIREIEAE